METEFVAREALDFIHHYLTHKKAKGGGTGSELRQKRRNGKSTQKARRNG